MRRLRWTPNPSTKPSFAERPAGVPYLTGESGYSPLEQIGVRPTAEVVGLHSGYGGPGIKTIVPGHRRVQSGVQAGPRPAPGRGGGGVQGLARPSGCRRGYRSRSRPKAPWRRR